MEASEITRIIEAEVAGNWQISNAHGVNLRRCLVPPEKKTFIDVADNSKMHELWLVLEEDPIDCDDYKVVFDEETGYFGLAIKLTSGVEAYLGAYGSFLETLANM